MPLPRRALTARRVPIVALAGLLVLASCSNAAAPSLRGRVVFRGAYSAAFRSWRATNGGPQCANFGTPSTPPRLRGTVSVTDLGGIQAARFQLPAARLPRYPLEACELITRRTLELGADDYYGYMVYVPHNWHAWTVRGNAGFWGVSIAQFHFQDIWAAPIVFELHDTHLTLALELGACRGHQTAHPGCQWRSNADNPNGAPGNLGSRFVIPAPLPRDVWNEVVMHVHWAGDRSGAIETWTRVGGSRAWRRTAEVRGVPTIQWDVSQGCCERIVYDKIGAYRGLAARPVSVWLGEFRIGTSFASVAAAMP